MIAAERIATIQIVQVIEAFDRFQALQFLIGDLLFDQTRTD